MCALYRDAESLRAELRSAEKREESLQAQMVKEREASAEALQQRTEERDQALAQCEDLTSQLGSATRWAPRLTPRWPACCLPCLKQTAPEAFGDACKLVLG